MFGYTLLHHRNTPEYPRVYVLLPYPFSLFAPLLPRHREPLSRNARNLHGEIAFAVIDIDCQLIFVCRIFRAEQRDFLYV